MIKNGYMVYYYDDLEIGDEFISRTRTISEADVMEFANLTGDFTEIHVSEQVAQKSMFKGRIAHGMLVLCMVNGMYVRTLEIAGSVFLGIDGWKQPKPVRLGDTIHLKMTIEGKRLTSKGDKGILDMKYEVINQNDEVAASGIFHRMCAVRK